MKIDPTQVLTQDDFCQLFEQVPLNDVERKDVRESYWGIYKLCLDNEVKPTEAWLATRNTFIARETQIKDRIEQLNYKKNDLKSQI